MPDPSDIEALHRRYQQQAGWTAAIRSYLLSQIDLPETPRILEVGCGTGVILNEITRTENTCFGVDIDIEVLQYASTYAPSSGYAQSDAFRLPFADNTFDMVFCHFFLLWASPLDEILKEIERILKPKAPFISFAEPDYGSRIDHPAELAILGRWQEQSLIKQGAHTHIGRELAHHLTHTGFCHIRTGVLGGEWQAIPSYNEEKETLLRDLEFLSPTMPDELNDLLDIDQEARNAGTRILFVPTFYAKGFKKEPCN